MINGFNFATSFVMPKLKIGQCIIKNRLFLIIHFRTNWFSGLHHARCSGLTKHPTAKGNYIPMLTSKNIIKVKAIKKAALYYVPKNCNDYINCNSYFIGKTWKSTSGRPPGPRWALWLYEAASGLEIRPASALCTRTRQAYQGQGQEG